MLQTKRFINRNSRTVNAATLTHVQQLVKQMKASYWLMTGWRGGFTTWILSQRDLTSLLHHSHNNMFTVFTYCTCRDLEAQCVVELVNDIQGKIIERFQRRFGWRLLFSLTHRLKIKLWVYMNHSFGFICVPVILGNPQNTTWSVFTGTTFYGTCLVFCGFSQFL